MRWHIVQHGFVKTGSHEYGEAQCWAQALQGRDWCGYGAAGLPAALAQASGYLPCFDYTAHTVLDPDPVSREVSDYLRLAAAFAHSLQQQVTPRLSGQDRLVVTYSTQRELQGAAHWLATLEPAARPAMAFVFHLPDFEWKVSADRSQVQGFFATWRHAANQLRLVLPESQCMLGATTPQLAQVLTQVFAAPVQEVPLVLPLSLHDGDAGPAKAYDIILPGLLRREKGGALLDDLLQALAQARPQLHVALQTETLEQAQALCSRYDDLKLPLQLSVTHGSVDTRQQVDRLRRARVVLLPYDAGRYALRASGVAAEAFMYGLPVVAPQHTWVADQMLAGKAAGALFDQWNAPLMAAAALAALDQLAALSDQAALLAPAWRAQAGAAPLLQQIEQSLA